MTLNLIIYTVAVATFLSVWTGLDLMFKSTDVFPDGVGFNGLICYVRNFHHCCTYVHTMISAVCLQIIGFAITLLVSALHPLFLWLYYDQNIFKNKTSHKSLFQMIRLIAYDCFLIIALIGNVSSFRGFWNILDAYFWPSEFLISREL